MFRYEDFVATPDAELQRICAALGLAFDPGFRETLPTIRLSGDSGRSSSLIAERPRRTIPDEVKADRGSDGPYRHLCARLGYAP